MEYTWKSSIVHEPLTFLRPNPFYVGFVRMLLKEQKVGGRVDQAIVSLVEPKCEIPLELGEMPQVLTSVKRALSCVGAPQTRSLHYSDLLIFNRNTFAVQPRKGLGEWRVFGCPVANRAGHRRPQRMLRRGTIRMSNALIVALLLVPCLRF